MFLSWVQCETIDRKLHNSRESIEEILKRDNLEISEILQRIELPTMHLVHFLYQIKVKAGHSGAPLYVLKKYQMSQ